MGISYLKSHQSDLRILIFSGWGGNPLVLPLLGYAQVLVKYLPTVFKRRWLLATYFSNIAPYSSPYWQPCNHPLGRTCCIYCLSHTIVYRDSLIISAAYNNKSVCNINWAGMSDRISQRTEHLQELVNKGAVDPFLFRTDYRSTQSLPNKTVWPRYWGIDPRHSWKE
jgi:hypothetical protein